MSWSAPPERDLIRRAWTLYRDGNTVYVHEQLFVPEHHNFELDATGRVVNLGPRETVSEDGEPLSHWVTTVDAIDQFLRTTAAA